MLKRSYRNDVNWNERLTSLLLWTVTTTVILISIADLIGVLDLIWLNNRIQTITLLAVGVVLLTVLVERHTSLSRLTQEIEHLRRSTLLRAEYLSDSDRVIDELSALVDKADETILSLGSKSTAESYLNKIRSKVADGKITYSRLLTGDHITHELHEHLTKLLHLETVTVSWTGKEKYVPMTISENGAVLVFPTSHPHRFRGLRLSGTEHAAYLNDVFRDANTQSKLVTLPESLELLCKVCGPSVSDVGKLAQMIAMIESGNSNSENSSVN